MQLQLALDTDYNAALKILDVVHTHIDIVEIGTPLIFMEGVHVVRAVKEKYPQRQVLADFKIMDAGEMEAAIAFEAGADIVTVLGVASDKTVQGAVKAAQQYQRKIMIDMIEVPYPVSRGRDLLDMGADMLCVHTAYDLVSSGDSPLSVLQLMREDLPDAPISVAGGMKLAMLGDVLPLNPTIIVVGGAITGADDPAASAKAIKERMMLA